MMIFITKHVRFVIMALTLLKIYDIMCILYNNEW